MKPYNQAFKRAQPALGTFLEITISEAAWDSAASASQAAFAEAARLEGILSRFNPASEVSRLNETAFAMPASVGDELATVLRLGQQIERDSRGAFRLMPACPHPPGQCYTLRDQAVIRHSEDCRFDLGGIAKGFVVDRVFELIQGILPQARVIVNAGGDLRTSHAENVVVRVPTETGVDRAYPLQMEAGALASSSRLGKNSTIGQASAAYSQPVNAAIASASVIAARCILADALTKVALHGERDFAKAQFLRFDRQGSLHA